MKIIIAGGGDVGFHLAKLLSSESQDIILIDSDRDVLEYAQNHLDVITLLGDSTSIKTLKNANIKDADLIVAATSSEHINIVTAVLGKKMGAKKAVARITKEEYLLESVASDFKKIGIDALVSPKQLAAKEIVKLINEAAFTDMFEFENGKLSLIGVTLQEQSIIVNKTLAETAYLNTEKCFKVIAIKRENKTIIPKGTETFKINDHVYFLANKIGIEKILEISCKKKVKLKNIMILGGSNIGIMTARMLEKNYNVKLIEKDKDKCYEIADKLANTLIINADGNNVEVLEEEGLQEMDAFIALTGNSETNIISSLVAKNHQVNKTIALVENIDYINLSHNIGVDTLINRKLIAANNVFRHVRKGRIKAITGIRGIDAEIIEYEVSPGSKITKDYIKNIGFPKTAVVAGVIRDDETLLPMGDFKIFPGDKVIVFSMIETINELEKFFN
jgi:trk system potassium uptake protein